MKDTGCAIGPISGGCFTAIVSPDGQIIGESLKAGEGEVIADLDFAQNDRLRQMRCLLLLSLASSERNERGR
jgi:aliphatic nitrilase